MSDPVAEASRAAAQRLTDDLGPGLAVDVEEALQGRGEAHSPERYLDPLSLGSLIVSVASLAWTVLKDLRNTTSTPGAEVVARRIRVELATHDSVISAQRDRIIDIVVSETIVATRPGTAEE
jgi:hypothetical protein